MTPPNPKQPLRAVIWCAVSTPEQAADDRESLPAQKRDLTAICETNGWRIVDTMEVPGFSRRYLDLDDFAEDLSRQPLGDEYRSSGFRLKNHLANQDFDVFVVRDGDRFGRSQSLFSRVAEDILFVQGKYIFAQHGGGLISAANGGREWITMQSYKASKEIDDLMRKRALGMRKRAERGILTSSRNPLSHHTVRDELGRALRTEVREDLRRLWDDLAQVILEGVSWGNVEWVLYSRFGHARPNGKPYADTYFYRLVHNPVFWGHNVMGMFAGDRRPDAEHLYGPWAFDLDIPPPEDVTLMPDLFEPVWTGELAEKVKSELRRRHYIMTGSARPGKSYHFTGLLVCAGCGRRMNAQTAKRFVYYRCSSNRAKKRRGWDECSNRTHVKHETVQEFFTVALTYMLNSHTADLFLNGEAVQADKTQQVEQLADEISATERDLERLIMDRVRSQTPEIYERLIDQTEEKLLVLRRRQQEVMQHEQQTQRTRRVQQMALDELAQLSVTRLWEQPPYIVNQLLHRLMGNRVLVCIHGNIVATGKVIRNRLSRE